MRTPPAPGGRQWVRPVVGDLLALELLESPTRVLPSALVGETTPVPARVRAPGPATAGAHVPSPARASGSAAGGARVPSPARTYVHAPIPRADPAEGPTTAGAHGPAPAGAPVPAAGPAPVPAHGQARVPEHLPTPASAPVAARVPEHVRARVPAPRFPVDGPTVVIRSAGPTPAVVDERERRRHRLAVVGATVVTICAAYVAVVGVSVLHGTGAGPVGDALAGLLPTSVSRTPDPVQDIADGPNLATLPSAVPARRGASVPATAAATFPVAAFLEEQSVTVTPRVAPPARARSAAG